MITRGLFLPEPFKLELRDVDVEQELFGNPPRSDMCIVKMEACGICGSDVSYFKGRNPWALHTLGHNLPSDPNMMLGHEIAGTIEDPHGATSESRRGEQVGIIAYKECGECIDCLEGNYNLCGHCDHIGHGEILPDGTRNSWVNFTTVPGGFADYFTCWHEKLVKLPESIDMKEATQLDGLAVSVHGANRVGIKKGGSVLVLGTGPIGFLSAQVAAAYGAAHVIVTDVFDKPFEQLEKVAQAWQGCELHCVNVKNDDPVGVCMGLTNNLGVDAVLDTIGDQTTVVPGIKSLRRGRRMLMFSGFEDTIEFPLTWVSGEREITSSCNNPFPDYPAAIDLLATGKINIKEMITHVFHLDDYAGAFDVAVHKEENDAIKVVIIP
ncbi:MAG TPA: alcohol dehydrogenase catalytic domain-containing protein [Candidatus Lokiarchaeia archaeon]|nr:alcohol dehydrogenase catalytic domain-containing protein [Candidatus Lokiarchaeia archaeon]